VIPGVAVTAICLYYAFADWAALQGAYRNFMAVAGSGAGMREVFVAEAAQNVHRVNLFADGVWALLGAILAGIGVHGLCVLPPGGRE
jgi:hypothetical protein